MSQWRGGSCVAFIVSSVWRRMTRGGRERWRNLSSSTSEAPGMGGSWMTGGDGVVAEDSGSLLLLFFCSFLMKTKGEGGGKTKAVKR